MICTDCHSRYRLENGHHSPRWCPVCLLDHVGLCRQCRRIFDRTDPRMELCGACSPSTTAASAARAGDVAVLCIAVQLLLLLVLPAVRHRTEVDR